MNCLRDWRPRPWQIALDGDSWRPLDRRRADDDDRTGEVPAPTLDLDKRPIDADLEAHLARGA